MKAEDILDAVGGINDEDVLDARVYRRTGFGGAVKWGTMAACLGLILAVRFALPIILKEPDRIAPLPNPELVSVEPPSDAGPGNVEPPADIGPGNVEPPSDIGPGNVEPPSNPDPGYAVGDDDRNPGVDAPPPGGREIVINWDNVAVNESEGLASDSARYYYDPALYDMEQWGEEEVAAYYGWNLAPDYIPEGLTSGGDSAGGYICREKADGRIVEDQAGRGFWAGFREDGSPKSDDDIVVPKGFTITVSKAGILRCGLLPVDDVRTTDFGSVSVILSHCSMPHGPFDPDQKAPNGLYHMPAGYYDLYTASFVLDGAEYEIMARRLELEEVVRIAASIIRGRSGEDFVVGNP